MPDLFQFFSRHRRLFFLLPLLAAVAALLLSFALPRLYKATTTALPANSALTDRARLFSNSIETLYPELGSVDELDRVEGTAQLDTLYLAVAAAQGLITHYEIKKPTDPLFEAALQLRKRTKVERSAYGELKISVWDVQPQKAALLANALLTELNKMHRQVRLRNYQTIAAQLEAEVANNKRRLALLGVSQSNQINTYQTQSGADSVRNHVEPPASIADAQVLSQQVQQYTRLLNEFAISVKASPDILLPVEVARAPLKTHKPNREQLVLFAAFAGLMLALLIAFFTESRKA